jgi:hypothetical protein
MKTALQVLLIVHFISTPVSAVHGQCKFKINETDKFTNQQRLDNE